VWFVYGHGERYAHRGPCRHHGRLASYDRGRGHRYTLFGHRGYGRHDCANRHGHGGGTTQPGNTGSTGATGATTGPSSTSSGLLGLTITL
jgi:hypothetical protein